MQTHPCPRAPGQDKPCIHSEEGVSISMPHKGTMKGLAAWLWNKVSLAADWPLNRDWISIIPVWIHSFSKYWFYACHCQVLTVSVPGQRVWTDWNIHMHSSDRPSPKQGLTVSWELTSQTGAWQLYPLDVQDILTEGSDRQQATFGQGLNVLYFLRPQVTRGKETRRLGTRAIPASPLPRAASQGKGKLFPQQSTSENMSQPFL